MGESVDVVVYGAGLAGATATAALARAGVPVQLVGSPAGPSFAGGVLRSATMASLPEWLVALPYERVVVEHRAIFLDASGSVSIDFQDGVAPNGRNGDRTMVRARATSLLIDQARTSGATVAPATKGADAGRDSAPRGTRLTIFSDAPVASPTVSSRPPASADGPGWTSLRRSYPMAERTIEGRFGVGPGQGVVVECVLGFLPPSVSAGGHLFTHRDSVTLGVSVRGDSAVGRAAHARSSLDALAQHAAIAPLLAGAPAAEESSESVLDGPEGAPRSYGEGLLLIGPAAGRLGCHPVGVPGVGRELASGLAAAETAIEAIRRGDVSSRFLARYPRRVRELLGVGPGEGEGATPELALNPRLQGPYPALLASALHEMMTEAGRPKETISGTLRRVRRASGLSWLRLARDAASALRSK